MKLPDSGRIAREITVSNLWRRATIPIGTVIAVGSLILSSPALAHRRDFPYTYDWFQPARGEHELESHMLYRAAAKSLEQQIEFEYGVSGRFMVAPYVTFTRDPGEPLRYGGFKVETRYQPVSFEPGRVLPGLYLEYEKPRGESAEIEGRLILSRYTHSGEDLSLNLITERSLSSGSATRATYSAGYVRPLSAWRGLRGGLEWIRNIDDGRLNAGPIIAFRGVPGTWFTLGYGLPVNYQGRNGQEFRLLAEYEWF